MVVYHTWQQSDKMASVMKERGLLITIEGVHGCGKSTVTSKICERLRQKNFKVVHVVDQQETEIGRKLRQINLESEDNSIDPITEALIIAAARHQNVVEVINPNLDLGRIVISERFNDALFAFQHFGRGLPRKFVESLNTAVADGIEPTLTLLLDMDSAEAMDRIDPSARHRMERLPNDFHARVRQGYLDQARRYPKRIKVINANSSADGVFKAVWKEVNQVVMKKRKGHARL